MMRFSNGWLLGWGIFWGLYNTIFGGSIFTYFMFGVCFGLIYLNYLEDKKEK